MIINWFDIIIVVFLAWGYFAGNKSDFVTEVFKCVGVVITTFIAIHYFSSLGQLLGKFMFIPAKYSNGFAFCFLVSGLYGMFFYMAKGCLNLLKVKCPLVLDKWGSIVISFLKSFLLCSLVYLMFVMLSQGVFARGAKDSFSHSYLSLTSAKIYEKTFVYFIQPIFVLENFNDDVFQYVPRNKFRLEKLLSIDR